MFKRLLFLLLATTPAMAFAVDDAASELQDFEAYADFLPGDSSFLNPTTPKQMRQKSIIPAITSAISKAAAENIRNAEQVFCYQVAKRPADYTGYTLSSFAITGYCGELDTSNIVTAYEALFTQGPNLISTQANCHIEPRVMLRFTRGIDSTDVLLSLPCPSFTVFYGGKYKAFNIKKGIITDLLNQFEKDIQPFNSPTLLKQTVANGTATTDKESDMLEKKKKEIAPVMKWKQNAATPKEETTTPKTGWGNIKLRK